MAAIPLKTLIRPAVAHIAAAYGAAGGRAPEAMIAAICLQESGFKERDQLEVRNGQLVAGAVGPATGFGQFEKNGGIAGVMEHPASRVAARELCEAAGVPFERDAIWRFFTTALGDELHMAFCRLLLLTDPQPLPAADAASEEEAFGYYLRNWRPGAWFNNAPGSQQRIALRAKWARCWAAAIAAVNDDPGTAAPVGTPPPTLPPALPTEVAAAFRSIEYDLARLKNLLTPVAR